MSAIEYESSDAISSGVMSTAPSLLLPSSVRKRKLGDNSMAFNAEATAVAGGSSFDSPLRYVAYVIASAGVRARRNRRAP
jgi:hypothetical protein